MTKLTNGRKLGWRGAGVLGALLLSLMASCGKTDSGGGNGETHFLSYCALTCGDGLSCLCGVCTVACDSQNACDVAGSTCMTSSPACGEATKVCDTACTAPSDCASLGDGYRCDDGRCRQGTPNGDPPPPPPEDDPIRDGSDDLRFASLSGGGFLTSEALFLWPRGEYLVVDGQCRYFAGDGVELSVRTGVLTEAQAAELATVSGWEPLDAWSSFEDGNCPDGGTTRLVGPNASAACSCGCDADAPNGLAAAIMAADGVRSTYYTAGTALDGPLRVVAIDSEGGLQVPPSQPVFDWPFTWPISRIVQTAAPGPDGGFTINDVQEVATLRALRSQNEQANVRTGIIVIRDTDGTRYNLLARDELPGDLEAQLVEFTKRP